MPKKIYIVDLTEEERTYLLHLFKGGKHSTRKLTRARILLLSDDGKKDENIADVLHIDISTMGRIRKKFVEKCNGQLDVQHFEKCKDGVYAHFCAHVGRALVSMCSWSDWLLQNRLNSYDFSTSFFIRNSSCSEM
jgi:hypothetical protein